MTTEELIDKISEAASKATKGEWLANDTEIIIPTLDGATLSYEDNNQSVYEDCSKADKNCGCSDEIKEERSDNINFIVELVNAWPTIRQHMIASEKAREKVRGMDCDDAISVVSGYIVNPIEAIVMNKKWRSQRDQIIKEWEEENV